MYQKLAGWDGMFTCLRRPALGRDTAACLPVGVPAFAWLILPVVGDGAALHATIAQAGGLLPGPACVTQRGFCHGCLGRISAFKR